MDGSGLGFNLEEWLPLAQILYPIYWAWRRCNRLPRSGEARLDLSYILDVKSKKQGSRQGGLRVTVFYTG